MINPWQKLLKAYKVNLLLKGPLVMIVLGVGEMAKMTTTKMTLVVEVARAMVRCVIYFKEVQCHLISDFVCSLLIMGC